MARRIAVSTLNASTIDILNTIRANASTEYQSMIPNITKATDIPAVGEVLYGYPALANQFINALVNRIALVRVKSAVFNNAYKELKKGYLEFGETVEEVFVNIAKVRAFNVDKAEARELKRSLPDVRTAFHTMNWRVQYPVTIQNEDLKLAFLSINGVQDLIAKIVDAVYTAAEYDEYLLFKYLLIKNISKYKQRVLNVSNADPKGLAEAFRGTSNKFTFMTKEYNVSEVLTSTPREKQCIFMSADFNAKFDVNVLASAFNMDKATFIGKLYLIDDFTTFDNERFAEIIEESDMIERVTEQELQDLKDLNLSAVLVDEDWFQVYDNENQFTEKYVSSGMYWNYFYNVWKTVSYSPFSNFVAFANVTENVDGYEDTEILSEGITFRANVATSIEGDKTIKVVNLEMINNTSRPDIRFKQTELLTSMGIAVHPYGSFMFEVGGSKEAPIVAEYKGVKLGTSDSLSTPIGSGDSAMTINFNTISDGTTIYMVLDENDED